MTGAVGAKGDQGPHGDPGPAGPAGQLFTPADAADAGVTLVAGSVATAPSDGTRLRTGTSRDCDPAGCTLADGPFVLTDARTLDTGSVTWFYTVQQGSACTVDCYGIYGSRADVDLLVVLTTSKPSGSYQHPSAMTGARYFIPAGRRLCMCLQYNPGTIWLASWSGFTPYQ